MYQVDLEKVPKQWMSLIRDAMAGEEVIITQANEPILKLIRIAKPAKKRRLRGSAKGQIKISDDFDEPLDEFREYMP